jgi:hypothetical protein
VDSAVRAPVAGVPQSVSADRGDEGMGPVMGTKTTTRCPGEGRWTHEGTREDGSTWYSPSVGDTSTCRYCDLPIFADVRYSGEASIEDFGGVTFRDETQVRDPLAMLAAKIGATLPFAVTAVEHADYGPAWLVGFFRSGAPIRVRVASASTISWFAEVPEDDAN